MGENLQEYTIKINLYSSFCVPEEEITKIREKAQVGQSLKFIKGNGEYLGAFVITDIQKTTEQTTPVGDLISVQTEIRLKEYAGKLPEDNEETEKGFKMR